MDASGDKQWTLDQGSLPVTVDQSSRPPLLVCKYRHGLYLCSYGCIDLVDLHCLSVSTAMVYTSIRMVESSAFMNSSHYETIEVEIS